jgi:hypothetical protein
MNARQYADEIIARSRDMMIAEHVPRPQVRAALLDITLAVARNVAARYSAVADQQRGIGITRQGKVLRDMKTLWRAVIKRVKVVYDNHPIHEKHLWAVMAVHHAAHLRAWPKLLDHGFSSAHQATLLAGYGASNSYILQVLEAQYEAA